VSFLQRIRERARGRHHLRRVSHEKAKAVARGVRRATLPQLAEKLGVATLAGAGCVFLLGSGVVETPRAWLALSLLVAVLLTAFLRYLADFRRRPLESMPQVAGLVGVLLLPLIALFVYDQGWGAESIAFLPLSFVAIVVALAWGRAAAIECTVFSSSLLLVYLGLHARLGGADFGGLAVSFGGALAAAFASEEIKRRRSLIRIGLVTGGVQALLSALFLLLSGPEPVIQDVWIFVLLGVQGVVVGILISGLLPSIEVLFGITTEISLLELGNSNEAPLLRKLLLEAGGTYHHSYVVGLLAEAAAEAVGANALLARVGALYHDIGKLNKSEYFAENSPDARARHNSLAPEMSMLIISSHPRDGVELGRYYGLPESILAFMPEHHGTSLIEYFYQRAIKMRGEESVAEESFRYPGPKPQSVETAIVMIADAAEAISRQMPDPTQTRLKEMVHEVAMKRLMDGQFEECRMTLSELDVIEGAIVRSLASIHHTRATYPKGRPNPLDLSQPGEQRRAAAQAADGSKERRRVVGGNK
jgi:cyclic-di-AMP phosphodiesterase PgpH